MCPNVVYPIAGTPQLIYAVRPSVMPARVLSFSFTVCFTWTYVGLDLCTNTISLDLDHRNLTGPLPDTLYWDIQSLDLSFNQLTGTVPPSWSSLGQALTMLDLRNNQLSGVVPSSLGSLTLLREVLLSGNDLTGILPRQLCGWDTSNIEVCDLRQSNDSSFVCTNTTNFDSACSVFLSSVCLAEAVNSSNRLPPCLASIATTTAPVNATQTGTSSICRTTSLNDCRDMYFHECDILDPQFSCDVPTGLELSAHGLLGTIPAYFFASQTHSVGNFTKLDLSQNQLSGPIPSSIGNLMQVREVTLNDNRLTGTLPPAFAMLSDLELLQLDNNFLSGSIPDLWGSLASLTQVSLTNNHFTGSVPSSLCKLPLVTPLTCTARPTTGYTLCEEDYGCDNDCSLGTTELCSQLEPTTTRPVPCAIEVDGAACTTLQQCIDGCDANALEFLRYSGGAMTGSLPSEIGDFAAATMLDVHDNFLFGTLA